MSDYTLEELAGAARAGDAGAKADLATLAEAALDDHPGALEAFDVIPGLKSAAMEAVVDSHIAQTAAPAPTPDPPIIEPQFEPEPQSIGEAIDQFMHPARVLKRGVYGSELQDEPPVGSAAALAGEFNSTPDLPPEATFDDAIRALADQLHVDGLVE